MNENIVLSNPDENIKQKKTTDTQSISLTPKKDPKIVIIVPYRDRESLKNLFDMYMPKMMKLKNENNYEILYCHQNDSRPFNRGAMKNLGFLYIKKTYPNTYKNMKLMFQDIDTLPGNENAFTLDIKKSEVKHFFGTKITLGGMFIMYANDFERINGFPNYWGWGMEDNILKDRCVSNKINVNYDLFHPFFSKDFIQCNFENSRTIDNNAVMKYKTDKKSLSKGISEIKNMHYIIENKGEFIKMIHFDKWDIPEDPKSISFRKEIPFDKIRDKKNKKSSFMGRIIHSKK